MWIDWLIVGIVTFSLIVGFLRGFVKEVISLGTLVVGIWLAINYHGEVSNLLRLENKVLNTSLAFTILILTSVCMSLVLNQILAFLINKMGLGIIDRFLGSVFGILRGIFLVLIILLVVEYLGFKDQLSSSRLSSLLQRTVDQLRLELVRHDWDKNQILQQYPLKKIDFIDKKVQEIDSYVGNISDELTEDLL